jgi:FkbM family methyltransferase
MRHYLTVIYYILSKKRSGCYAWLIAYLKIILKAHLHHRFSRQKAVAHFELVLMGLRFSFLNYSSFLHLFEEIFIREIYFFASQHPSPFILDCGSNIGLSILYFKKQFPSAKIIGFEPDFKSFELLKKNIDDNKLSDITIHNMAVGGASGERSLYKTKTDEGSVNSSLIKTSLHNIALAVKTDLLSNYILQRTDFLKIDTEGAEGEIVIDLCSSSKIALVNQLFIEYHRQCETSLFVIEGLLMKNGFKKIPVAGDPNATNQMIFSRENSNLSM